MVAFVLKALTVDQRPLSLTWAKNRTQKAKWSVIVLFFWQCSVLALTVSYVHKQVGMKGEQLGLHTVSGSSAVEWQASKVAQKQSLTWYKVGIVFSKGQSTLCLNARQ